MTWLRWYVWQGCVWAARWSSRPLRYWRPRLCLASRGQDTRGFGRWSTDHLVRPRASHRTTHRTHHRDTTQQGRVTTRGRHDGHARTHRLTERTVHCPLHLRLELGTPKALSEDGPLAHSGTR